MKAQRCEPTCALVCVCELRHLVYLNVRRCANGGRLPDSSSGSRVGHPKWDKVKENVCCWHYLDKRTRRATRDIARIFAHPTNKQTKPST